MAKTKTKKPTKTDITITMGSSDTGGIAPLAIINRTKRLFDSTDGVPLKDKIGALILTQTIIDSMQGQLNALVDQLKGTPIADVMAALAAEGSIPSAESIPVFTVVDKAGRKTSKILSTSLSKTFSMDDFKEAIKDPDVFSALPDEYKITTVQSKAFFEALYKAGALGAYEGYFSLSTTTSTVLKACAGKE